jgi:hypothetical protein
MGTFVTDVGSKRVACRLRCRPRRVASFVDGEQLAAVRRKQAGPYQRDRRRSVLPALRRDSGLMRIGV